MSLLKKGYTLFSRMYDLSRVKSSVSFIKSPLNYAPLEFKFELLIIKDSTKNCLDILRH